MAKPYPVSAGNKQRKGFTLIELLVVMAIIGTLMALLFPAINKVRAMADKTALADFIKQLTQACRDYKVDPAMAMYPWGPMEPGYDPDAATTTSGRAIPTSATIVRLLAPTDFRIKKGDVPPTTHIKSFVSIPNRFIGVPEGGSVGDETIVDLWQHELKFMPDSESLEPVVWSRGENGTALAYPADGDETKDDFLWNDDGPGADASGKPHANNGRWDFDEKQGDGDYGDDIGPKK